jgi:hypothetical protein
MIPADMVPLVVEVYAGYNIWFDPAQGFYWVDGFEPTFWTVEAARAAVVSSVPTIASTEKPLSPLLLLIGSVLMLL